MARYLAIRLLLAIVTVFGMAIFTFSVVRFLPGDAVDQIVGQAASGSIREAEELERQIRADLGLDRPAPVQFARWLGGLLKGDLGTSLYSKSDSIRDQLASRLPISVQLGVMAILVALIIGVPVGALSAVARDRWPDYLSRGSAVLALSVPYFWTAVLVIVFGAKWFGWTPPLHYREPWTDPLTNLEQMLIPAVLLGVSGAGQVLRVTRTELLEVLSQDYMRTAHAKGLSGRVVLFRHALRNALIPVLTIVGVLAPLYMGGIVALEVIFGIPGLGTYLVRSLEQRDYPVVQVLAMVLGAIVVAMNLVVDMLYAYLDPRIRY
jgi:peptide/nickel transport system permease protein